MIHVGTKLHWSDDQWYELIYVKSPRAATMMEGGVKLLIDDWNPEETEEELMKHSSVPSDMKKKWSQREQNVMSILIVFLWCIIHLKFLHL